MIWINLKTTNKKLTKNKIFIKNTWCDWYNWLIKFIPEPINKALPGLKTKLWALLKPRIIVKENASKLKRKKQSDENITKSVRNLFKLKEEDETIKVKK